MKEKENWLFIKSSDDYGKPEIVQINNNSIDHFVVNKGEGISLVKSKTERQGKLSDLNYKFLNEDRIRFFIEGKNVDVYGDGNAITEDAIFEHDYEKLLPTKTDLTESAIQDLKFKFKWNNEEKLLSFNTDLDSPSIQKVDLHLNRIRSKILLEKLDSTLFLSFYSSNRHQILLPIKYVDQSEIILSGFPQEPYEISCSIIQ